jgi:predicted PurR-regulated permease PerM
MSMLRSGVQLMLVAACLVVVLLFLWTTAQVLLLVFASIVLATLLRGLADLYRKWTGMPRTLALWMGILSVVLVVGGIVVLFGVQVRNEIAMLGEELPGLVNEAGNALGVPDLGNQIFEAAGEFLARDGAVASLVGYTGNVFGAVGTILLVVAGGIFIAFDAEKYSAGLTRLLPPRYREKGQRVLDNLGRVLRLWIVGQLVAMVVVGVATTAGLYALGVRSALALGLLAALLEFIPFIGPVLAYGAALMLALPQGMGTALAVTVLYVLIQQLESNLLVPLIQQRTVELPAALALFSLVAISSVFGPLGLLLGVPLTVCVLVVVKELYVRDMLENGASTAGAARSPDAPRE